MTFESLNIYEFVKTMPEHQPGIEGDYLGILQTMRPVAPVGWTSNRGEYRVDVNGVQTKLNWGLFSVRSEAGDSGTWNVDNSAYDDEPAQIIF